MEPTTSHRPLGDVPSQTHDLRPTARLTVLALILWAVIDMLRTIMAVGHYEDRITVVTHGNADVMPAWMAYRLFDHFMPRFAANAVADRSWIAVSLVAAAAFITWLHYARRNAARLGGAPASARGWAVGGWLNPMADLAPPRLRPMVSAWWVTLLVTVLVHGLGWLYHIVTSRGGVFAQTTLDTRWVAYPLWTVMSVMTVLTATRTARVVRQITKAQQP